MQSLPGLVMTPGISPMNYVRAHHLHEDKI